MSKQSNARVSRKLQTEWLRNLNDINYRIDGFRSLRGFEITIRPGLNVLVGPNGSGKSNFLELLGFLGVLVSEGATSAVSFAGGVGRVFGIESSRSPTPTLTIDMSGTADFLHQSRRATSDETRSFRFLYSVTIKFSRDSSVVYIQRERLSFSSLFDRRNEKHKPSRAGTLSVYRPDPLDPSKRRIEFRSGLNVKDQDSPLFVTAYWRTKSKEPQKDITQLLLEHDESIFGEGATLAVLDAVRFAISQGKSCNIDPSRVRESDDLSSVPIISPNGAGLSTTLYSLHQIKLRKNRKRIYFFRKVSPDSFDNIMEWAKLVLPELSSIEIQQDPITGKYQGYLVLEAGNQLRIPFAGASDGTLKWLAIVSLVVAQGGMYSIEEPENFLHPRIQQFFVALIRDSLTNRKMAESFILSTHSETLINECRPEEMHIFEYCNGSTIARDISDPKRVQDEINMSGFGLGYYYASNAVS